mmetsp:Transcript_63091/g.130526  ORF Transcript_63091/g.130526 Transcript_63091/m.130526 type:complete len:207 (-) Transcript_63091:13-633(-)
MSGCSTEDGSTGQKKPHCGAQRSRRSRLLRAPEIIHETDGCRESVGDGLADPEDRRQSGNLICTLIGEVLANGVEHSSFCQNLHEDGLARQSSRRQAAACPQHQEMHPGHLCRRLRRAEGFVILLSRAELEDFLFLMDEMLHWLVSSWEIIANLRHVLLDPNERFQRRFNGQGPCKILPRAIASEGLGRSSGWRGSDLLVSWISAI